MYCAPHGNFRYFELCSICLKGQCHEIFCFWFFSWISFPQASVYTIRVVSNFCENSRIYSQLKVCHRCQRHRWQMEKTFKQKNFNNFVWTPLGRRVKININFCLQVHWCLQPDIVAIICRRYRWHRWQICHRYYRLKLNNASKIDVKICRRSRWYLQKETPSNRKILIILFGHLWVVE